MLELLKEYLTIDVVEESWGEGTEKKIVVKFGGNVIDETVI